MECPRISLADYTLDFVAGHRIKAVSKSPYRLMAKYLMGYGDRTNELLITHKQFREKAATVYGESSAYRYSGNTVPDDLKCEF